MSDNINAKNSYKQFPLSIQNIIADNSNLGYIYILYHPSYDKKLKISRATNPKKRLQTHCCSHVVPPKMIYTIFCINYKIAETIIHQKLSKFHFKCISSREFFQIDLNEAINIIESVVSSINNPLVIDTTNDIMYEPNLSIC
jgi:hypothetical protein